MENKGFVLTLDAIVAVFVVLAILGYANSLVNESEVTQWSEHQMLSTGYEVVAMLDHRGVLDTMNQSMIQGSLVDVMSRNYDMRIEIRSFRNNGTSLASSTFLDAGPASSLDSLLQTHGRRTFVTFTNGVADTYNVVDFWIWLK